jgi:Xaa-Pro aminopeptidase
VGAGEIGLGTSCRVFRDFRASKPFETIEEHLVFTIEPRVTVPGGGVVTIEEMVLVTAEGAQVVAASQTELMPIG